MRGHVQNSESAVASLKMEVVGNDCRLVKWFDWMATKTHNFLTFSFVSDQQVLGPSQVPAV